MQQMSLFFFSSILSRQFEIVPEDDPQNAIVASSALTCHSNLLKAVASVRYRRQQHQQVTVDEKLCPEFC